MLQHSPPALCDRPLQADAARSKVLETVEQEINAAFASLPLTAPYQTPPSPVLHSLRDDQGLGPTFVTLAQDLLGKLKTIAKTCESTHQVRGGVGCVLMVWRDFNNRLHFNEGC